MPEIPFIGGSYKGRSTNLNAQVSQNLYPVMSKDGKAVTALYGVPGMIDWTFNVGSEAFGPGKDLFRGSVSSIYKAYDTSILRVLSVDSFPWNFHGNVSIKGTGFNKIPNDVTKIRLGGTNSLRTLVSKTNTEIVLHVNGTRPHSSEVVLIDNDGYYSWWPNDATWGYPGLYTVEGMFFDSIVPNRWSKNMGVDGSISIVITGRNFTAEIDLSGSILYLVDMELLTFHYHPESLIITPTTITLPSWPAGGVRTHYNASETEVTYAVYFLFSGPSLFGYSNTLNVPAADSTITLVTPSTGIQGDTVTLTGTDFPPDPTWIVNFGSSVATENTRVSSTQFTCKVPVPPVSAPCDVNVAFGTAHSTLVNGFHYSA